MNLEKYLLTKLHGQKEDVVHLVYYFNLIQFDISKEELGEIQLIQLFMEITSDFYQMKIGAEMMCILFGYIYIFTHHNLYLKSTPTANIMFDAMEYGWYLRNSPNNVAYYLRKVKKLRNIYLKLLKS